MRVIRDASPNTLKILGAPAPATNGQRWMAYVVFQPVEAGVLAFHTLTRELVLLTREEYAEPDGVPELRDRWFRVPAGAVDKNYADQVRFVLEMRQAPPEHVTSYSVFTTTDCNARCAYCFEAGRARMPMSEGVARQAAACIAARCGGDKVHVSWFGGEPLCNVRAIDVICEELTASGVEWRSTMLSNGYLFDDATVARAAGAWNLRRVQVTLDGTEDAYNRAKAYVYAGGESPYRVVMGNIGRLLDVGIHVVVRMNLSERNADDIMALTGELEGRFGGRRGLTAYSHVLFEFAGARALNRTDEGRARLYARQRELTARLRAAGLARPRGLARALPLSYCMADGGRALTILPDGSLGLCDHYSEDNFVGHLGREGLDESVVRRFRERHAPTVECDACFRYPECIRLKMCEESRECFPETRAQWLDSLREGMLTAYESEGAAEGDGDDEPCPEPC